jgi:transmembrane sensor
MTPQEHILLYEKCHSGNCTLEERKLMEGYMDGFDLIEKEWSAAMGDKEQVRTAIYSRLQNSLNTTDFLPKKIGRLKYWVAAASVILVVSVSLLLFKGKTTVENIAKNRPGLVKNSIVPGSNKAILTLADGSTINLDNSNKGTLTHQGSTTVNKLNNGQLVYSTNNQSANGTILYNTATTPRGGQYQVVLSDGTKVWLNSASSIKYPVTFSGKERHIELTGEAYFEVAKNKKMPFTIAVKGNSIEVLGTHFNVMAYSDDKNLVTTLLEGSVKLKRGNAEALLKPGEQALIEDGQEKYEVSEANTDDAVAWKNGYFVFDNENIQSIMKKVSRWYDIDVKYAGVTKDQSFGGTVSRFSNVDELFKVLELTGTVHFKIEGRMITVTP